MVGTEMFVALERYAVVLLFGFVVRYGGILLAICPRHVLIISECSTPVHGGDSEGQRSMYRRRAVQTVMLYG